LKRKHLQFAIGKERLLEGTTFEARRQACVLVVKHVVIHANGVIVVHIALFHHLIGTPQDFHNPTTIPAKQKMEGKNDRRFST
jgi:hypothetical protein